jgi:histidine ammonia-lyase
MTRPPSAPRIRRGADFLDRLLREDGTIYGVTTGYGDSCTVTVPSELVAELPHHLYTYHGCGLGPGSTPEQTRRHAGRAPELAVPGFSGVSVGLLEQPGHPAATRPLPLIPKKVGGRQRRPDAAVLRGRRPVRRARGLARWHVLPAGQAWPRWPGAAASAPRRAWPLMNGTAVMTGLACLAFDRARYLPPGHAHHRLNSFAPRRQCPPFRRHPVRGQAAPGQMQVAAWLRRTCLPASRTAMQRLQDRYSLRCAPHVIGVLADACLAAPVHRNRTQQRQRQSADRSEANACCTAATSTAATSRSPWTA